MNNKINFDFFNKFQKKIMKEKKIFFRGIYRLSIPLKVSLKNRRHYFQYVVILFR